MKQVKSLKLPISRNAKRFEQLKRKATILETKEEYLAL